MRDLQHRLPADPGPDGFRFDVFLTHYHSDHVEGLRFFAPLFDPRSRFVFHGLDCSGVGVQEALEESIRPPWFPLRLQDTPSSKEYVSLSEDTYNCHGVKVTAVMIHHPQGAAGYRLERNGRAIAILPDTEPGADNYVAAVRRLAKDAAVLIHDAQYTPTEYNDHYRSWGHSSWMHAVEVARHAGAERLVLFHHDPERSDDQLDQIQRDVRKVFPTTDVARQGMTFEL